MLCIGIDISKARFDGAVCVEDVDHNPSFAHDHKGFKALSKWLKSLGAAQERLCKKPSIGMPCGKPNPLNPPCQGDLSLNSPLIRGARGVRNDEILSFCTVSKVPLLNEALLPTPNPQFSIQKMIGSGTLPIFAPAKSAYGRHGWRKCRLRRSSYCVPVHPAHKSRHLQRFTRLKRLCKNPSLGMR